MTEEATQQNQSPRRTDDPAAPGIGPPAQPLPIDGTHDRPSAGRPSAGHDELQEATRIPHEPLGKLFLRFLRFGFLAWGGPVAQIAMIQQELVVEERWISRARFRRALAVYQVLPGPEAHELCVYFGTLARGRVGGLLAGLGFMLPGFVLMFALSWLYVRYGLGVPVVQAAFAGVQVAVVALVLRAVFRIAGHTLQGRWSWAVAGLAAVAQLAGMHFAGPLVAGGLALWLAEAGRRALAAALLGAAAVALTVWIGLHGVAFGEITAPRGSTPEAAAAPEPAPAATGEPPAAGRPGLGTLAWSGLRTGLLTFGGAYTAIPFLQRDAVERGGWMSHAEFLDGLALSGILPAPLIIFATFVGFVAGGAAGAVVVTAGIFVPAFAFTMVGHEALERVVERQSVRHFLDGIAAAVVGLIAAVSLELLLALPRRPLEAAVFAAALVAFFRWRSRLAVPVTLAAAALAGLAALGMGWTAPASGLQDQEVAMARVVFVCEHGAAKSVVAAAHFERLARERGLPAVAVSRGTTPDAETRVEAVRGLAAEGLAPVQPAPEVLTAADLESAAVVATFCDLPPAAAGAAAVEHWTSPPVSEGYDAARDAIVAQVEALVDRLAAARARSAPAALPQP